MLPDLFFFSVIVTIVRLIRGDPAAGMLGTETTSEVMAQIRREMGLDQPGHRWPPGDLADPHALARQMVGDLVTRTPAG